METTLKKSRYTKWKQTRLESTAKQTDVAQASLKTGGEKTSQPEQRTASHSATAAANNTTNEPSEGVPPAPSGPYLPFKVMGRSLTALADTGCAMSMMEETFNDQLPKAIKLSFGLPGANLANGSKVELHRQVPLPTGIRHNRCIFDVGKSTVKMEGYNFDCIHGNYLRTKIQALKTLETSANPECTVVCRLTNPVPGDISLVEGIDYGISNGIVIAARLVKPNKKRTIPERCYKSSSHPVTSKSGIVTGDYCGLENNKD